MIVLKRARSQGGRAAAPPTQRRSVGRPSYHRRNPAVLGTPLEDAAAVAGGIYVTQQVAGALSGLAAPLVAPINAFKAGIGTALLTAGSAVLTGRLVGLWKRHYGNMAQLGGMGLATSQAATAIAPGFNPMGGQPALMAGGLKFPSLKAAEETKAAAPALPAVASQL